MRHLQFVEVFTTNVGDMGSSTLLQSCLAIAFDGAKVSFDLEDVDRVLRIASPVKIDSEKVINVLSTLGFQAEVMPEEILDS